MQTSPQNKASNDPAEIIEAAKSLLANGRAEQALLLLRDLLRQRPEHSDALYVFAVCLRYAGKLNGALETVKKLQTLKPAYGRAWQEEGHVQLRLDDIPAARKAFSGAVARNESLLASWQALEQIALNSDDQGLYARAAENRKRLAALPEELLAVRSLINEKRLFDAEQICRHFLKSHPQHVEGMRLLADLGVKTGVLDDAEFILESAVEFEPQNRFARFDYMNVLYRRQKYAQAHQQAAWLRDNDPDNLDYEAAYANQCVAIGQYDEALALYEKLALRAPDNSGLHLVHGHALKTVGDLTSAIESYRKAYTARPQFGDAYWSLANLKTYRFEDSEVSAMRNEETSGDIAVDDRVHLCFALGKHFEDVQDFALAMEYYVRGNALRREELQYDAGEMSKQLQLQSECCDESLMSLGGGADSPDPIFIVGLPRAGSTLLEQILASHSQVDGTMELPNVPALAHRLDGRRRKDQPHRYPGVLRDLDAARFRAFGDAYIADTRVHRGNAAFFIDKMPNNFRHIGLIHRMLPNAKIIDARRHPMACCFSGFKQLFATGQEFTYGLTEIGTYYRDYVQLMDHWDTVLPGRVLRVQYEDVVADLETQVNRILDYCGLPFEEACLSFHRTERSVRTPSSEQVRQPIYTSGLKQWQHFEPWLEPLKTALGDVLDRYPLPDSQTMTTAG